MIIVKMVHHLSVDDTDDENGVIIGLSLRATDRIYPPSSFHGIHRRDSNSLPHLPFFPASLIDNRLLADEQQTVDMCKTLVAAGIDVLTVHCRTSKTGKMDDGEGVMQGITCVSGVMSSVCGGE